MRLLDRYEKEIIRSIRFHEGRVPFEEERLKNIKAIKEEAKNNKYLRRLLNALIDVENDLENVKRKIKVDEDYNYGISRSRYNYDKIYELQEKITTLKNLIFD